MPPLATLAKRYAVRDPRPPRRPESRSVAPLRAGPAWRGARRALSGGGRGRRRSGRGARRRPSSFAPGQLELGEHRRALVGDLEPIFEDRDGRGRLMVEPQCPAKVVKRVAVVQACFVNGFTTGAYGPAGRR